MQLKIKRGLKENLPELADGEFGFCTDTKELFVGSQNGNQLYGIGNNELVSLSLFFNKNGNVIKETNESATQRIREYLPGFLKASTLGTANFKVKFKNVIYDFDEIRSSVNDPDFYNFISIGRNINQSFKEESETKNVFKEYSTNFQLNLSNFNFDETLEIYKTFYNQDNFNYFELSFLLKIKEFNRGNRYDYYNENGFANNFYYGKELEVEITNLNSTIEAYSDIDYNEAEIGEEEEIEYVLEYVNLIKINSVAEEQYKYFLNNNKHNLSVTKANFEYVGSGTSYSPNVIDIEYYQKNNALVFVGQKICGHLMIQSTNYITLFNVNIDNSTRAITFIESASSRTITIPNIETIASQNLFFSPGTEFKFIRHGTGTVTFVGETGGTAVILNSKNNAKQISPRYGVATLTYFGQSVGWVISGDIIV